MRRGVHVFVWFSLCLVLGFAWSVSAVASGSLPEGLGGGPAPRQSISLESPFAGSPVASPKQMGVDVASRTAFAGLRRERAVELADQDFQIDRPPWVPPTPERGARFERYIGQDAVAERLPHGGHDVVSSTIPLRVNDGSGLAPVSLSLRDDGEAYVPANPLVAVAISTHASGGVAFPDGLSVAPTTAAGAEAPILAGNRVVFANVARDTDLIDEPQPHGAAISWQLRSQDSPQEESLTFRLPPGGRLRWSRSLQGAVEVLKEGKPALLVPRALGEDAAGKPVPVSYAISGNVLSVHVELSGEVEMPVLVDPEVVTFEGDYGESAGDGSWAGWTKVLGTDFELIEEPTRLGAEAEPPMPFDSGAQFGISAPGPQGKAGSAGISRVSISGLWHGSYEEAKVSASIEGDSANEPVFSFYPTNKKETFPAPMEYSYNFKNALVVFCARWTGEAEGEPEGLCDEENYQGSRFYLDDTTEYEPTTSNQWLYFGEGTVTYREPAPPNRVVLNHPGYEGQWLKTGPTNFTVEGEDEGLGVAKLELQNGSGGSVFTEESSCQQHEGFSGCPSEVSSPAINLSPVEKTGEIPLEGAATSPGLWVRRTEGSGDVTLNLDKEAPVIGEFGGSLGQAAGHVIGSGNYTLNYSAQDGSTEHPQSGAYSLELKLDGHTEATTTTTCPQPINTPAANCYGLSGSWTMNGQAIGAGSHTITVVAKDWAGNQSEKSFNVTVNEAPYEPVGPGAVNLETGDFKLNSTDVSLSGGAAELSVSRSYDSRKLTAGATGPLGPQWALSLPDSAAVAWQSLIPLANGSIELDGAHGETIVFTAKGAGSYNSPPGYQDDTLTEVSAKPVEYELINAEGDYTKFAQPSSGGPFVPSQVAQASTSGGLNKVAYSFTKTSEGIIEPTQVLGPEPSEGACKEKLVQGCRALTFTYSTETTANGEDEAHWGEYKGRLRSVSFTAWEATKGEMTTTIVAKYEYDGQGRLRAEWDPRIQPPIRTIYGYDSEGHVTVVSSPGQQPWLMHYGAIASDASTGRLLSVSRFNAATVLWTGKNLSSKTRPELSTSTPAVGATLSTTVGTWTETPLVFSYQWERCSSTGEACAPILGATNATYTPVVADVGHAIVVQVTATGTFGSVAAKSAASAPVSDPPTFTMTIGAKGKGSDDMSDPTGIALAASGDIWVADSRNERLDEFAPTGAFIEAIGWGVLNGAEEQQTCTTSCKTGIVTASHGGFSEPYGIAINQTSGDMYVDNRALDDVEELSPSGAYIATFGEPGTGSGQLSGPQGMAIDSSGDVWVADTGNCRLAEFSEKGAAKSSDGKCGETLGKFLKLWDIATSGAGVYATDAEHPRVQELVGSEWLREFGTTGSGKLAEALGIAADAFTGDLDVGDGDKAGTVDSFTSEGAYVEAFGKYGTTPEEINQPTAVATNPTTGATYIVDYGGAVTRIDAWTPTELTQEPVQPPPTPGTTAVTTIEYQVPVSGTGAPQQMTSEELAKWGQKDRPEEATSIFPPDEPQGWPASDYKRATTFYMDSANRTVNTVTPNGAIATTEYNEANDNVQRALTPDNRERALKEGTKSAEVAGLLSTESTYNSSGTELTSALGPQHTIKLGNGTEALARKHTQYVYNEEEAPGSGRPYDLVTKTIEGAEIAGQEEKEQRTVTNSYNGQENLGWKLHAPTSTTTSAGAQTLVSTTSYEPSTGEVKETQTPAATGGGVTVALTYISQFGKPGTEPGQLKEPKATAINSAGNVLVLDSANSRVEEFSPTGAYITKFGSSGTGNGNLKLPYAMAEDTKGNLWVADSANNRVEEFTSKNEYATQFGKEGTAEGQFKEPRGIAVSPSGNIFVADDGNNRIEKFNSKGEFLLAFGYGVSNGEETPEICKSKCQAGRAGPGNGQFNTPRGIAISSSGEVWVADMDNYRIEEFNENGEYLNKIGSNGKGNGQFEEIKGIAIDTFGNIWVADASLDRVQKFSPSGTYLATFGEKGTGNAQFEEPWGMSFTPSGNMYIADVKNSRVEQWNPEMAGNAGAHDTQTIYYTAAANESHSTCGKHPEWANLPCQAQPAAQPGITGLPNLPVTTYTYNIWDEPLTTTDTVTPSSGEKTTRATTLSYDAAGRPLTSAISSTIDAPVETVTDEYNKETGALAKQSTPAKSITSEYNTLGQLTSYTDTDGNVTKYEYEPEKDFRLTHVTDGEGTVAASTQTYGYEAITGELSSLKDSAAGTFTASYDIEGNLTTEGYPNGMDANYTYNQIGEATNLEYIKTTHCTTGCTWYTNRVTPSIHNQWLSQTSTLSNETYSYDETGRLAEAQETPAGKACTARLYAYDEDGNRTSLTTRESTSSKCATEGGTVEGHTYDTSDRLDDAGVSYETFGNTTSLPAADAGGSTLTSTYYINDTLASQEQNGEKISYKLDPDGRTRETISEGTTKATAISHYDGPGDSPAWTTIPATGSWTRNITGINGALSATQTNGETPILQLADLHGDIIGTALDNETESKFTSANETSEYGVPHTNITAKYAWLGADQRPTELPTGIINMGARGYIPQLGRFEQTDPQPGGSVNAYAYTDDDPVNQADPSGEDTTTITYNYEAAETGAPATLPGVYTAPGAVTPPQVNMQLEEAAYASASWNAAFSFTITLGGGSGAHAAKFSLTSAWHKFEGVVSHTFSGVVQTVKTKAVEIWDGLNSELFSDAFSCVSGADELTDALDAQQWSEFPYFTATVSIAGCAGALRGADYGGTGKTSKVPNF